MLAVTVSANRRFLNPFCESLTVNALLPFLENLLVALTASFRQVGAGYF